MLRFWIVQEMTADLGKTCILISLLWHGTLERTKRGAKCELGSHATCVGTFSFTLTLTHPVFSNLAHYSSLPVASSSLTSRQYRTKSMIHHDTLSIINHDFGIHYPCWLLLTVVTVAALGQSFGAHGWGREFFPSLLGSLGAHQGQATNSGEGWLMMNLHVGSWYVFWMPFWDRYSWWLVVVDGGY